MIENVLDTIQGLIFTNLPKQGGKPTIYDKSITFEYGDVYPTAANMPAVVIQADSGTPEDFAFGTVEMTYKITISCWVSSGNKELSERHALEFGRLVYDSLLGNRIIWVCPKEPISGDAKMLLSPEYYYNAFPALMSPFMNQAYAEFTDVWSQTHSGIANTADLPIAGVAAAAIQSLFNEVEAGVGVTNLPALAIDDINAYIADGVKPVRMLYNNRMSNIELSSGQGGDNSILISSVFTLEAKELIEIPRFGPNQTGIGATAW